MTNTEATKAGDLPVRWATTTPHPWKPSHTHGADDGQIGWRLHLVAFGERTRERLGRDRYETIDVSKALCGLRPRHGWGLDMFVEDECSRCIKAAEKAGIKLPDQL
jgi:hypothetical protein